MFLLLMRLPVCVSQCCNLMLVEVIPKEPLSFSVFHYKNPKLQHTVQVQRHCCVIVNVERVLIVITCLGTFCSYQHHCTRIPKCDDDFQVSYCFGGEFGLISRSCSDMLGV